MAQKATLVVLLLVFVGAIFIHYMLTYSEGFKNKKRGLGRRSTGRRSTGRRSTGRRSTGKRSAGKRKSGKRSAGKRKSGKRSAGKRKSGKGKSGKGKSGKGKSGKRSAGKRKSGKRKSGKGKSGKGGKSKSVAPIPMLIGSDKITSVKSHGGTYATNDTKCNSKYNPYMKYSDVMGSLLTPSLPDSRDLKDKLHAAVDRNITEAVLTRKTCSEPRSNCAITTRQPLSEKSNSCPGSNMIDLGNAVPYVTNMNEYIKKDRIPCYGCNLK